MSDEHIRGIVRNEITSQWACDQFYRQLYGVGQPVNEAMLAHYVSRGELSAILNNEVKSRVFEDVHRIMGTTIGIQELFARYRDDLDGNLRVHAKNIENQTVSRLQDAQGQVINDILRTDDGNRIITAVEHRVSPGIGFYAGIAVLGFAAGGMAGAMAARLI